MTNSRQRPAYQTATAIRAQSFRRRMRGLDADTVYGYLDLLADQVEAKERQLGESLNRNERLQAELKRVQAALDEYEQLGDRVNEQVVHLFSQAQLVAEEMVQDVSRDARERIGLARAQERRIVQAAMDTAGRQVRSYAQTAQSQMESIMRLFNSEVDRLAAAPPAGGPDTAPQQQNGPLYEDWTDRQLHHRKDST